MPLYKIILIHTSVKLVTHHAGKSAAIAGNFNPHEREARDAACKARTRAAALILIHTSVKLVTHDLPQSSVLP